MDAMVQASRLGLAPQRVVRVQFDDGSFVLRSPQPLRPYARCIGEWLETWARDTPDAFAFAERAPDGGWRTLTWAQTRERVGRIAQSLLGLKLAPQAPIVVLSDNALDHLLLLLAGMHIGRAVCTVSSAYCRMVKDGNYSKIHGILNTLGAALIYASDAAVYGPALASSGQHAVVVFSHGADSYPGALRFESLAQTAEGPAVMDAFNAITPDTHAKYLLTSGSTGHPKVVINTHRMLCANQQMIAQVWRFLDEEKPVLADWLPWSHTFGANNNLNMVLRNGGFLAIDDGRPLPGQIERSVRNLCEVRPTIHFNVPRGVDMLLPFLEGDDKLAQAFFSRLRGVFYAGAGIPQSTWDRLQALALRIRGEPIWLTTSWGSTETSPAITSAHWWLEKAGNIGLPLPGVEVKFVPNGEKLEMRVRGVNIFPGYRDAPQLTAQAFDAEGYYCIGDAGYLADPEHAEQGIVFDGRVAEDFKLNSGTWVSVGTLRVRLVSALAPWAQDVVITGHDRSEVGLFIFPSAQAAALPPGELRAKVAAVLRCLEEQGGGSSQTPTRALVLDEPPNSAAGEITDKGYINQGAVLRARSALVDALYADCPETIFPE
ncbi:feruloyl-CoA synthase [Thiomonas sp. FB-Cd]|uniref:feruloyl-CoA synthase n=1 Tax=Thiomonas sp. FB-Cd TaxID=1158292 RepID=UPI0004DEE850